MRRYIVVGTSSCCKSNLIAGIIGSSLCVYCDECEAVWDTVENADDVNKAFYSANEIDNPTKEEIEIKTKWPTENGEVIVTGRIKRIMITKGKDGNPAKMFPDRIEKTIYCCPAVEQCCAIGIPDKDRISIPIAYVQLKSKEDEETAKRNIFDICRKNLPDYMVPDEIWFLYDIPRTSRRKIDYRALEKLAEKENNN